MVTLITEEEIDMEEHVDHTTNPKIFALNIDMEKLVNSIDSVRKAVLLAVQAERYAAEFFEGLAEKAETEDGRQYVPESGRGGEGACKGAGCPPRYPLVRALQVTIMAFSPTV